MIVFKELSLGKWFIRKKGRELTRIFRPLRRRKSSAIGLLQTKAQQEEVSS